MLQNELPLLTETEGFMEVSGIDLFAQDFSSWTVSVNKLEACLFIA